MTSPWPATPPESNGLSGSRFTLPNVLTALRLLLVLPIGYCIWERNYPFAFYLALVSAATDGLDGWIARRFSLQSRLGTFLDPAADKFTALAAFYLLSLNGEVPLWLFALAVARDASLFGGFFVLYLKQVQSRPIPIATGRLATFCQFLLIFAILLPPRLKDALLAPLSWQQAGGAIREGLVWLSAATLLLSLIAYGRASLRRERRG